MSLPDEKIHALKHARRRILELGPYLHGKGNKALVSRQLLQELFATLKHYPADYEIDGFYRKD